MPCKRVSLIGRLCRLLPTYLKTPDQVFFHQRTPEVNLQTEHATTLNAADENPSLTTNPITSPMPLSAPRTAAP